MVPIVGDGASAALDLTNTGIDISRLDYNQQENVKKKKKVDADLDIDVPNNRGALKTLSRVL